MNPSLAAKNNANLWYAVFDDPRGKQYAEDDCRRTVYFEFDGAHRLLDSAREALRKRYPEIADTAHMVAVAAWGHGIHNIPNPYR
jgi:hypothetical protein